MFENKPSRSVAVRRIVALATVATGVTVSVSSADASATGAVNHDGLPVLVAQKAHGGEGESEGAAIAVGDSYQDLQRDLSFMEGHLRAGLALYETGDLAAAKTHMGHPIEEKYDAVAGPLEKLGFGVLRGQIEAIAAAAEAEAPFPRVKALFEAARVTMEEVRAPMPLRAQVLGLAGLARVAGNEYAVAVRGGTVSNLHEYQDSWGFLRVIETEALQMAQGNDKVATDVGREILRWLGDSDAAFGDLQGVGTFRMDPGLIYGAAARIEIAGLALDADAPAGKGDGMVRTQGEGEGEGESGR